MLKNIKILFIDDDKINQALNEAIVSFNEDDLCGEFSLESIERIYSHNLAETEEMLKKCKSENNFLHIILSDIQLIEGTGFDFLDIYKKFFLKDFPKTVVALISAMITDEDETRLKKYPFAFDIFVRPINVEILRTLIKEAIEGHS